MDVPISRTLEAAQTGTFHYLQDIRDASIRGVFVFSFYTHFPWGHPDSETLAKSIYVKGIQLYVQAVQRPDSIFHGWKIVLYTDRYTYDWLRRLNHEFVSNPIVVVCVVDWPYYQRYSGDLWGGQVKGDVLRCMRLRAFFEFSQVPVFMRDADTLWAVQISQHAKRIAIEPAEIYEWEASFLRGSLNHPNTFIFGTSLAYNRFWHRNDREKKLSPLGAFAGFQNAIPSVPCFQDPELWEQAITFIVERSKRTGERKPTQMPNRTPEEFEVYTNNSDTTSLGKDEQILAFLILPACIRNTFFFELDLFHERAFALKGKSINNSNYSTLIFERGNNANLRRLFTQAIEQEFKRNLESERKELLARNLTRQTARGNEVLGYLTRLRDPLKEYTSSPMAANTLYHMGGDYSFCMEKIFEVVRSLDKSGVIAEKRNVAGSAQARLRNKREQFVERVVHAGPDFPLDSALAELQTLIDERSQAFREFLDAALPTLPREELLKRLGYNKKNVQKFLDWYDGKPLSPPAGGARKTKRRKHTKRRTRKN